MTPVSERKPPVGRPVIGIWAGRVHDCATVRYGMPFMRYVTVIPSPSAPEWQSYHDTDGEAQEWRPCNEPTYWMEFGEVE